MHTLAISLALLVTPALAGWLAGLAIRRARRGRASGVVWPIALLGLVLGTAIALDARSSLVGIWDAATIAGLFVGGLLVALHKACSDPRNVAVSFAAAALACLLLESLCRFLLPPPPAFPSQSDPALLVSDALRASAATQMSTTISQVQACDAIYETASSLGIPSPSAIPGGQPRGDARRRVLHIGDSIAFCPPEGCFLRDLNVIEPDVEHINAAIPATSTDAQLAIIRRWISQQPIDAVVMHLNPNDPGEIDRPFPCSGWQSLMVYDGGAPQLRFRAAHTPDPRAMRLRLLLQNSPPPYLLRAAVRFSAAAAHLAATCVSLGRRLAFTFEEDELRAQAHVTACLRAARDELRARHIPLVVDILHWQRPVEERKPDDQEMKATAEALGIVTIDSWVPLTAALDRGEQPFLDPGGHLNATGHAIMARWLHEQLPAAIERARGH
jgi:hypothetical protein